MDRKLFQETFSRLHASDEAKEEVLLMAMQQSTKRRGRLAAKTAGIAAAAMMGLVATAGAINAATDGQLFTTLTAVWSDGFKTVYQSESGDTFTGYQMRGDVEERDGRLFLLAGGQEIDITDALAEDGSYTYEVKEEGFSLLVEVTGSPERWSCTNTVTVEDITYSDTVNSWETSTEDGVGVYVFENEGDGETGETSETAETGFSVEGKNSAAVNSVE